MADGFQLRTDINDTPLNALDSNNDKIEKMIKK